MRQGRKRTDGAGEETEHGEPIHPTWAPTERGGRGFWFLEDRLAPSPFVEGSDFFIIKQRFNGFFNAVPKAGLDVFGQQEKHDGHEGHDAPCDRSPIHVFVKVQGLATGRKPNNGHEKHQHGQGGDTIFCVLGDIVDFIQKIPVSLVFERLRCGASKRRKRLGDQDVIILDHDGIGVELRRGL